MPGWAWAIIWTALVLGSLAYFAWLGLRLAKKAKAAFSAAEPSISALVSLANAANEPAKYEPNPHNLLDDPREHIVEQARLSKLRQTKADERQRRLINKLIDFKPEESEINNGRT
jgi:hypothetical protein